MLAGRACATAGRGAAAGVFLNRRRAKKTDTRNAWLRPERGDTPAKIHRL